MKIEKVREGIKCNWGGEVSNGWEEMFVDSDVEGDNPAYYHLR